MNPTRHAVTGSATLQVSTVLLQVLMKSANAGSFAAWVGVGMSWPHRTTERAHISHTGGCRIEAREPEGCCESRLHSVVLDDTFRE